MPKRPPQIENDDDLKYHYQRLGFASEGQYRVWCENNGIRWGARKGWAERERESALLENLKLQGVLKSAREFDRRPEDVLRAMCAGNSVGQSSGHRPNLWCIRNLFNSLGTGSANIREAFLRLLLVTCRRKGFEDVSPVLAGYNGAANSLPGGLLMMARRYKEWRREPETWKPTSHNGRRQFSELARHLFCDYPVPGFLESAWFWGPDGAARRAQDAYMRIGTGVSLRHIGLPFTLTKRMAHAALTAVPDTCSVVEGWRWAQVIGMGGSNRLARALIATPLAFGWQADEEFWETVIRFFVDNPLLDPASVGPLVDYLRYERLTPRRPGDRDRLPEGFTMKGRTVAALMERMENWHRRLAQATAHLPRGAENTWPACGLPGHGDDEPDRDSGKVLHWAITELKSAKELTAEGAAMSHCVGSYAASCVRGGISVWSVTVRRSDWPTVERVMTIAVSQKRQITEARGKRNALPGGSTDTYGARTNARDAALLARSRRVVREWATVQNLQLPSYL